MPEHLSSYSFGICGTTGPDPLFNPGIVLRDPTAQAIVRLLNEQPRSTTDLAALAPELAARIAGSDAPAGHATARQATSAGNQPPLPLPFETALRRVLDLRAAAERGGLWHIGFPLLTGADQEFLRRNLEPFAHKLAGLLLGMKDRIDGALELACWRRPLPEVRLAVIGCMALDWAALAFLAGAGITHAGHEYPDGGRFTILGAERPSRPPGKLYCSSHSDRGLKYSFTGFGDNSGPRYGLPDAFWMLERLARETAAREFPAETAQALAAVVRAQRPVLIDAAGAALAAAADGADDVAGEAGAACRQLLRALRYTSDEGPQVLLFQACHWPAIEATLEQTLTLLVPWIESNWRGIAQAAGGTSPARNGVDPSMFFVELWHDVFGVANRIMAEEGWLHDPDRPAPGQARYLTWCAENVVYRQLQEWLRDGGSRFRGTPPS